MEDASGDGLARPRARARLRDRGQLGVHAGARRRRRAPALGLAAGLLFAGGDISVKLVVRGGLWLFAIVSLVAFYAFGTMRLQAGFQQGDALTAAGIATLATNAVPIAAGFALFGESLPGGARGGVQIAGFAAVVVGAVVFGSPHA